MNTNDLAKLYDRLKPAERLPLLIAAGRRGDAVESQRLSQAAPRMCLRLPDYFPLGEALQELAMWHLVQLLDLAAKFWQAWGIWGWSQHPERQGEPLDAAKLLGMVQLYAYHFEVHSQAWATFCAELRVEPAALLDFLPAYDIIQRTREHAPDLTPTQEEATDFLRLYGEEGAVPPTVEGIAGALRVLYQERTAWWDGSSA